MTTNRVQTLREAREMPRTDLASKCGVSERTVQRWEEGTTGIPDTQKRKLAELFEVSVEYLLGWDSEKAAA